MWQPSSFSNSWFVPGPQIQQQQQQQPQVVEAPISKVAPVAYFSNSWFQPPVEDKKIVSVPKTTPPVHEGSFVKVNGQYWAMVPVSPQSVPPSTPVPEIKTGDIEDEISAQNLYKTELCRSFQETGTCRYGAKCQFAHGKQELRPVIRHPKYKTEVCKTFHTIGTCPYGKRCRFIHTRKVDNVPAPNEGTVPVAAPSTFVPVGNNAAWPPALPKPVEEKEPQIAMLNSFHKSVSTNIVTPPFESDINSLLDSDDEDDAKSRLSFFQSLA